MDTPEISTPMYETRPVKNHIAQSKFKASYTPSQHKGRRVPLHLLEKVENELNKLIDDGQSIKLE